MPKTDMELTEIIQVRMSPRGLAAVKKAASKKEMSLAAYVRQAVYIAAGLVTP